MTRCHCGLVFTPTSERPHCCPPETSPAHRRKVRGESRRQAREAVQEQRGITRDEARAAKVPGEALDFPFWRKRI